MFMVQKIMKLGLVGKEEVRTFMENNSIFGGGGAGIGLTSSKAAKILEVPCLLSLDRKLKAEVHDYRETGLQKGSNIFLFFLISEKSRIRDFFSVSSNDVASEISYKPTMTALAPFLPRFFFRNLM